MPEQRKYVNILKKIVMFALLCATFHFTGATSLFHALAPNKKLNHFVIDNWQIPDNLPADRINKLIQTSDGYIWPATENGLARFDGIKFTVFNKQNYDVLPDNYIHDVREDNEGTLWIASQDGLTTFKDGKGALWVGTRKGLNRIDDGRITPYQEKDGLPHN